MDRTQVSWLHEARRAYLLYVAAGLSMIPAASLYAWLRLNGLDRRWITVVLMGLGCVSAHFAWALLDRLRNVPSRVSRPRSAAYLPLDRVDRVAAPAWVVTGTAAAYVLTLQLIIPGDWPAPVTPPAASGTMDVPMQLSERASIRAVGPLRASIMRSISQPAAAA